MDVPITKKEKTATKAKGKNKDLISSTLPTTSNNSSKSNADVNRTAGDAATRKRQVTDVSKTSTADSNIKEVRKNSSTNDELPSKRPKISSGSSNGDIASTSNMQQQQPMATGRNGEADAATSRRDNVGSDSSSSVKNTDSTQQQSSLDASLLSKLLSVFGGDTNDAQDLLKATCQPPLSPIFSTGNSTDDGEEEEEEQNELKDGIGKAETCVVHKDSVHATVQLHSRTATNGADNSGEVDVSSRGVQPLDKSKSSNSSVKISSESNGVSVSANHSIKGQRNSLKLKIKNPVDHLKIASTTASLTSIVESGPSNSNGKSATIAPPAHITNGEKHISEEKLTKLKHLHRRIMENNSSEVVYSIAKLLLRDGGSSSVDFDGDKLSFDLCSLTDTTIAAISKHLLSN